MIFWTLYYILSTITTISSSAHTSLSFSFLSISHFLALLSRCQVQHEMLNSKFSLCFVLDLVYFSHVYCAFRTDIFTPAPSSYLFPLNAPFSFLHFLFSARMRTGRGKQFEWRSLSWGAFLEWFRWLRWLRWPRW